MFNFQLRMDFWLQGTKPASEGDYEAQNDLARVREECRGASREGRGPQEEPRDLSPPLLPHKLLVYSPVSASGPPSSAPLSRMADNLQASPSYY